MAKIEVEVDELVKAVSVMFSVLYKHNDTMEQYYVDELYAATNKLWAYCYRAGKIPFPLIGKISAGEFDQLELDIPIGFSSGSHHVPKFTSKGLAESELDALRLWRQ